MKNNPNIPSVEVLEEAADLIGNSVYMDRGHGRASVDVGKIEPYEAGRLVDACKSLANLLRAIEEGRWAIVPCEATDMVDLTVVGRRCVYINDYRICGDKPYMSENLPQHSFNMDVRELITEALAAPTDEILSEMFGGCDDRS